MLIRFQKAVISSSRTPFWECALFCRNLYAILKDADLFLFHFIRDSDHTKTIIKSQLFLSAWSRKERESMISIRPGAHVLHTNSWSKQEFSFSLVLSTMLVKSPLIPYRCPISSDPYANPTPHHRIRVGLWNADLAKAAHLECCSLHLFSSAN